MKTQISVTLNEEFLYEVDDYATRNGLNRSSALEFVGRRGLAADGAPSVKGKAKPKAPRVMGKAQEADGEFEEFWSHYPRRVGKGAARQAWGKLILEERKAALGAVLIFEKTWTGSPRIRFCPYPATWLNQKRWFDEPADWKIEAWSDVKGGPPPEDEPETLEDKLMDIKAKAIREGWGRLSFDEKCILGTHDPEWRPA